MEDNSAQNNLNTPPTEPVSVPAAESTAPAANPFVTSDPNAARPNPFVAQDAAAAPAVNPGATATLDPNMATNPTQTVDPNAAVNPTQAAPAPQPGIQPQPGTPQTLPQGYKVCEKNLFVWVFAFLLGGLGVDRFMRGQIGLGVCKLLFNWLTFNIWALVDWIIAMTKAYGAAFGRSKDLIFDDQGRYTA